MKLRLLTKQFKSRSLRKLAEYLTKELKYKVLRSDKILPNTHGILYGFPVNKLAQYKWFKNNDIPSLTFTESQKEAKTWVSPTTPVIARTLINSSKGKGIVVCNTPEEVIEAPVYTKYEKKKQEFRVHIFKNTIVNVAEKRLRKDWNGPTDPKIRNLANGYVFCFNDVVEPPGLRELALIASKVTLSDFKGVDIGYNQKQNKLFVIEVNSAPGIEGSNIQKYSDIVLEDLKNANQ